MMLIHKVKNLRKETGVSISKCKEALVQAHGDIEGAKNILHEWELLTSNKTVADSEFGIITSCIHNGRVGVLIDVRCQTESASKHPLFIDFCENLLLQIASMKPEYIVSDDVPIALLDKQRNYFLEQIKNDSSISSARRPHIANMMVKKWLSEVCLMHQRAAMVEKKSIEDLRVELMQNIKEDVLVKKFARFELG